MSAADGIKKGANESPLVTSFVECNQDIRLKGYFFCCIARHSSITALQAGVALSKFSGLLTQPLLPPPPMGTLAQGPSAASMAVHSLSNFALLATSSSEAKALVHKSNDEIRNTAILMGVFSFLGKGERKKVICSAMYKI
ncbi:MAG: hypothetical protein FWF31_04385 [Desulfobulbus sp.]|nr:hypothetical protein [Desulfobulbus sp.]